MLIRALNAQSEPAALQDLYVNISGMLGRWTEGLRRRWRCGGLGSDGQDRDASGGL